MTRRPFFSRSLHWPTVAVIVLIGFGAVVIAFVLASAMGWIGGQR